MNCVCLHRDSTFIHTWMLEGAMDPTPWLKAPSPWLYQNSIYWREPYLPYQRWWKPGSGLLQLGAARGSRRARGRAQDRLTYAGDTVAVLGGESSSQKQPQKTGKKRQVRKGMWNGEEGKQTGRLRHVEERRWDWLGSCKPGPARKLDPWL